MDAIRQIEHFLETFDTESVYYDATMNILRSLDEVKHLSITQVADMCCVSQSTVSKLVKRLGFTDFGHFKIAAAESLARHDALQFDVILREDILGDFAEYLDRFKVNVMATLEKLDFTKFTEAARLLRARRQVALMAYSIHPGSGFIAHMLRERKFVRVVRSPVEDRAYAQTVSGEDVAVAYIGGSADWGVKGPVIREIRARGGKVIAFASDLDFACDEEPDFLFRYDARDGSLNVFFQDLYLRILVGEYKKLEYREKGRDAVLRRRSQR